MDAGREPRDRPAEDRAGLGGRQEVARAAGSRVGRPVVPARRVVQRDLHEPGEGHRPVPADLVTDRLDAAPRPTARRPAAPGTRLQVHDRPREHEPQPGPDERVAAEERSGSARRARTPSAPAATDRRSGPGAAGRSRTGPRRRASRARPRRSGGRAGPGCRPGRASPSSARSRAEASGPSRSSRSPRLGADRALVRPAARPEAALLDQGAGPRGGRAAPARRGPRPRSGRRRASSAPGRGDRRDSAERGPHGRDVDPRRRRRRGPRPRTEQHSVERRVEVDLRAASAAEVVDRDSRRRSASQRGRALSDGEVAAAAARAAGAGDRDDVGRVAVVGERRPAGRRRPPRRTRARSAGRASGIAARAEDDEPVRADRAIDELAEPRAERPAVRRPVDDRDVVAPAAGTRAAMRARRCAPRTRAGRASAVPRRRRGRRGCRMMDGDRMHAAECSERRAAGRCGGCGRTSGSGRTSATPTGTLARAVRALAALPGARLRARLAGCTRPSPSASSTSPSSGTPSSPSTCRPGPIPRPARPPSSSRSSSSSGRSGASERERWGPRELDLDLLVFGRARLSIDRPPEGMSARSGQGATGCSWCPIARRPSGCSSSRRWPTSRRGSSRRAGHETVATAAAAAAARRGRGRGPPDRDLGRAGRWTPIAAGRRGRRGTASRAPSRSRRPRRPARPARPRPPESEVTTSTSVAVRGRRAPRRRRPRSPPAASPSPTSPRSSGRRCASPW